MLDDSSVSPLFMRLSCLNLFASYATLEIFYTDQFYTQHSVVSGLIENIT